MISVFELRILIIKMFVVQEDSSEAVAHDPLIRRMMLQVGSHLAREKIEVLHQELLSNFQLQTVMFSQRMGRFTCFIKNCQDNVAWQIRVNTIDKYGEVFPTRDVNFRHYISNMLNRVNVYSPYTMRVYLHDNNISFDRIFTCKLSQKETVLLLWKNLNQMLKCIPIIMDEIKETNHNKQYLSVSAPPQTLSDMDSPPISVSMELKSLRKYLSSKKTLLSHDKSIEQKLNNLMGIFHPFDPHLGDTFPLPWKNYIKHRKDRQNPHGADDKIVKGIIIKHFNNSQLLNLNCLSFISRVNAKVMIIDTIQKIRQKDQYEPQQQSQEIDTLDQQQHQKNEDAMDDLPQIVLSNKKEIQNLELNKLLACKTIKKLEKTDEVNSFKNEYTFLTVHGSKTCKYIATFYLDTSEGEKNIEQRKIYSDWEKNTLDDIYHNTQFIIPTVFFTYLKYMKELSLALCFLGRIKMLHRDLKKKNILVDQKGLLKLIDFGSCASSEPSKASMYSSKLNTTLAMSYNKAIKKDPNISQVFSSESQYNTHPCFDIQSYGEIVNHLFQLSQPGLKQYCNSKIPGLGEFVENMIFLRDICVDVNPRHRPLPQEILEFIKLAHQLLNQCCGNPVQRRNDLVV